MDILSSLSSGVIYIIVTIGMLIFGMYLMYLYTNKSSKNVFYHFDQLFVVLIYGTIFSRILWFILNFSNFNNFQWSLSPYIKTTDFFTNITTYTWFQSFPWKILDLTDNGFYFVGVIAFLVIYSIYIGFRDYSKIFYSITTVGIGLIPLFLWYLVYLELGFHFYSTFSMNSVNTAFIVQIVLVLVSSIVINWLVLKKKAVDIENIQNTRNEKNDLVKEIAAWTRLKNFGNIRKNPQKIVNNPSIRQPQTQN